MVKLDGDVLLYKHNSWLGQKIVANIHSLKIVVTIQAKNGQMDYKKWKGLGKV